MVLKPEMKRRKKLEDKLFDQPDPAEHLLASILHWRALGYPYFPAKKFTSWMVEGFCLTQNQPFDFFYNVLDEELYKAEDPQSYGECSTKQYFIPDKDEYPTSFSLQ